VITEANVETDGGLFDNIAWYLGKDTGEDAVKHHMISGDKRVTLKDRLFAEAKWILYMIKSMLQAANKAKECSCLEALRQLGEALHSLQDSYAHAVWPGEPGAGLPITDGEHRDDMSYDDPSKYPERFARAEQATIFFLMWAKDVLGCCCGDTPSEGQQTPCQPVCE